VLNAVTYYDTYPLPHIDTCLNSMDGSSLFSTLDLRSGYHNIPIREQDRDKTAFITCRGCFRYKDLPFGCTIAHVGIPKTYGHDALWVNIHYVFSVLRRHHRTRT